MNLRILRSWISNHIFTSILALTQVIRYGKLSKHYTNEQTVEIRLDNWNDSTTFNKRLQKMVQR